ncbi:hypothetical protein [Streptomyces sp. NPDC001536]|uniref:hypothetical protein n=1 Tax=Streptomyces sp. NPDC001536 TaxID=3364583 RepID=UPI003684E0E6
MSTIRKKLCTITSSLLLACSLALVGATVANSAHSGHNEADSWWGTTQVVAEGEEAAPQEVVVEVGAEPDAVPLRDSAWG